jgi:hypothetical protein
MGMRRRQLFDTVISVDTLDLKVSPTFLSVGGLMAATAVSTFQTSNLDDGDPPPEPAPPPGPYPGDNPPIVYPLAPPSGPAGPGFST